MMVLKNLVKHFPVEENFLKKVLGGSGRVVRAVDGVSLELKRGEIFGLVGESGSGKTTLARVALRLLEPTSGEIFFDGQNITHLSEKGLRPYRRRMQTVFQDPHGALNPAMTMGEAIGDPLIIHMKMKNAKLKIMVKEMMEEVGLHPSESYYEKYPSDLSGGEKQRAVIARAMILAPDLVFLDEPVAMLDMSVRSKILELLLRLKREHRLTYLFVTHDLAVARLICDRIGILYLGRIVELGKTEDIFQSPKHPYTQSLLEAIPKPDPRERREKVLPKGEIPDAISPPGGCSFHPRCPKVFGECGLEGQDLLNLLEEAWDRMDHEERNLFGDLKRIVVRGREFLIPVSGSSSERIEGVKKSLKRMMTPPMLGALGAIESGGDHLLVRFKENEVPELKDVEGSLVACQLY